MKFDVTYFSFKIFIFLFFFKDLSVNILRYLLHNTENNKKNEDFEIESKFTGNL